MNARLVLLLWLCLRFPLSAQLPADLDPPFKVPEIGVTVVSPTPLVLEGLRKHYKLPAYEEDKAVKDKPMIEVHFVDGFAERTFSYFIDPNDTSKIISSISELPGQKEAKVDSPALLKSLLDQLVFKLKDVKNSGVQITRGYKAVVGGADRIILTHHLMTPDRILIIRGCPAHRLEGWSGVFGYILYAITVR